MASLSTPIRPVLPWASPSDSFELFEGVMLHKSRSRTTPFSKGRIQLLVRSGSHLVWSAEGRAAESENDPSGYSLEQGPEWLDFAFLDRPMSLRVHKTSAGQGFVSEQPDGSGTEALERVVVHWVNLPHLPFGTRLRQTTPDGAWEEWGGRHELDLGIWRCRIDSRSDLKEVFTVAKAEYLNVVTHVMEVRRSDGMMFSPADLSRFLTSMQFGVSFALSRWVAPILPVGFSRGGDAVWSEWASWHIDPPMHGSGRWWVNHRPEDLWSFLRKWVARWENAEERPHLAFLVTSALAAGEGAFVEQRLMTSLAAIENLSWITEVLSGRRTKADWRSRKSHWRIRRLLGAACIPISLVQEHSPALGDYARELALGDGPVAVCEVRDRLTHPKDTEDLYSRPEVIAEASRVARWYLDLLLLHYLGYEGRVADRTRIRGRVGESEPVPWNGST